MRIAFTGTRRGMTLGQKHDCHQEIIRSGLTYQNAAEFIAAHGCCVGADVQFHLICIQLGIKQFDLWPSNDRFTNSLAGCQAINLKAMSLNPSLVIKTTVHAEMKPLDRNWEIVRGSDLLLAAPKESYEITRSGTWSTVRIARKLNVKYEIIEP